jgi:hypothetical protein
MPKFPAPASGYSAPVTTIWSAPSTSLDPVSSAPLTPIVEPPAAAVRPLQPAAVPTLPPPAPVLPQAAAIRLKAERTGAPAVRVPRSEPRRPEPDPYGPILQLERTTPEEPRAFPWKLAAAAVLIVTVGIVVGRAYLPGRSSEGSRDATPAPAPVTVPVKTPKPLSGPTGQIDIVTQPAGARVLVDGEDQGETPLKLETTAGRHVLTFMSASGSVKRNVRVEAGKTLNVEVPLFSGWVAIFAPVVLEVSEGAKSIGTTDDGRLMLSPGRHDLTFTNKELGYKSKQAVDIDSGEVKSITVDARGTVNFNAVPWAEVWIDGTKAGDTPLANEQVQLGTREIVFKNPEFGERRSTITVRADEVGAVSVDFTKKQ